MYRRSIPREWCALIHCLTTQCLQINRSDLRME
jgi:hypothetical protein